MKNLLRSPHGLGVPRARPLLAWCLVVLLVAACGGDGPAPAAGPPDPLPPAGASRWAAVERDVDADGSVDLITLYDYDAAGRPAAEKQYRAVGGVPAGPPQRELRWSYDGFGRITGIVESEPGSPRETRTTLEYGADGRLALRRDERLPTHADSETRFVWRDGRIVEAVRSGASAGRFALGYGADGLVEQVEYTSSAGDMFVTRYRWRPDRQLASAVEESLIFVVYLLDYDAAGRHVSTLVRDDGIDVVAMQLGRDAQGRVSEVAEDDFPDSVGFVADRVTRYRWEAARCQPVLMPVVPPYRLLTGAGQVASDNLWIGCGP